MQIVLSGGDLGGEVVEWVDGEETLTINGLVYKLIGEQAVFVGQQ